MYISAPGSIPERINVKLALPAGSPLREPLNRALLEIVESPDWSRRVERYIGPGY
jgi:ABC-type amino acid transport substrate-binding protein